VGARAGRHVLEKIKRSAPTGFQGPDRPTRCYSLLVSWVVFEKVRASQ